MIKNIFTLILCLSLTSCFLRTANSYEIPVTYDPDATPEWKLGWQHGCESGYSAYGNDYYKTLYKFKQDVTMVKNEYYFKAWNDGFNFCRAFVNRRLAGNNLSSQNIPAVFSTTDLNVTAVGLRSDSPITKTGFFSGKDNKGFFGEMFEVYAPGYGSMAWGASASKCDWLNRCGDDIPKDPMGAMWGDW